MCDFCFGSLQHHVFHSRQVGLNPSVRRVLDSSYWPHNIELAVRVVKQVPLDVHFEHPRLSLQLCRHPRDIDFSTF
jgi:hypothetical protein